MAIYIGIGSNLGDRLRNIHEALRELALPVYQMSSIYETEPLEYLAQAWFFNAVISVECDNSPRELLRHCQSVEVKLGRIRDIPKGPRTIDLDILFHHDAIVNEPDLILPHPQIPYRRFVLEPLAEIAPDLVHPVSGLTIRQLLAGCKDKSVVRIL